MSRKKANKFYNAYAAIVLFAGAFITFWYAKVQLDWAGVVACFTLLAAAILAVTGWVKQRRKSWK